MPENLTTHTLSVPTTLQRSAVEPMTNRQRALAVLRYQPYDRLPLVHFGFWANDTLEQWAAEGHLSKSEIKGWRDGNAVDTAVAGKLGFDFNWNTLFSPAHWMQPGFESKVVETFPDGTQHVLNSNGVIIMRRPDAGSIPAEVDHKLKDRASWEKDFKWRFQFSEERVTKAMVNTGTEFLPFDQGGLAFLQTHERDFLYGLKCGSLYGNIRNVLGLTGSCYLQSDDEELFDEILETVADLCYRTTEFTLKAGARFDFAHYWEDICFRNGPLISPPVFEEKVGPHYKRLTKLLNGYGIDIISLDSDGKIDSLIPTWLENGVNTMFPIEVGTWDASIGPWREKYGRALLGVGGMNKNVFAQDRAAVNAEVERLKPLVDLGGYLPCPDHRIAPDAKFELVQYYCERMRAVFG